MPVMPCILNGRPGYRWGQSGKCYTYDPGSESSRNRAKKKAILQGAAIKASGYRGDAAQEEKPFITFLKAHGMTVPKIRSRLRRRIPIRPIPRTVERKYGRYLRSLVASWRTLYLQTIDSQLEGLAQEAYAMRPPESVGVRSDAWPDKLDTLMGQYEDQVTATLAPMGRIVQDIGNDVAGLNLKQWRRFVAKAIGINVYASEPWLSDQISSFAKQNSRLVTKLADETRADIERIVEDGFQRGRRIENIRKDILSNSKLTPGRFRKTRTRATLIARDQTNKLNGQLSQLRQNEIKIDRYIWHTVADERVRVSHRNMNGLLCRWDNATVYSQDGGKTWVPRSGVQGVEMHPGQDIQCRCYPEADFSSVLGDPGPITTPRKEQAAPSSKKAVSPKKKKKAAPPPVAPPPGKRKGKKKKGSFTVPPGRPGVYIEIPDPPPSKSMFTKAIQNNNFETLGVVDSKTNRLIAARRGMKNQIDIPDDLRPKLKDQVVIHNHPGSSSFSEEDIKVALTSQVGIMEVTSKKYIYKMKNINKQTPVYTRRLHNIHRIIEQEVRAENVKKIIADKITIARAEANYWHEVNKRFAKETGLFKYERRKR